MLTLFRLSKLIEHPMGWLLLTIVTFYSAQLSIHLSISTTPSEGYASVIWMPAGILLGVLLRFGRRALPAVMVTAFMVPLLDLLFVHPPVVSWSVILGISLVHGCLKILQPSLIVVLLRRWMPAPSSFDRVKYVSYFLALMGLTPLISSTLLITLFCLTDLIVWKSYYSYLLSFWLGDTLAHLLLAPLFVVCTTPGLWQGIKLTKMRLLEGGLLLGAVLWVAWMSFQVGYPIEYVLLALLIAGVLRFGRLSALLLVLLISGIAIQATVSQRGSFATHSTRDALLLLESFLGICAITCLVLAAMVDERQNFQSSLLQANAELSKQQYELTQVLNALPLGVIVHAIDGSVAYLNRTAEKLLGKSSVPEVLPSDFSEAYGLYQAGTDQLYPKHRLPVWRALAGETFACEDIEVVREGKRLTVEVRSTPILDSDGHITQAIVACQDITDRKRAETILADYARALESEVDQRTAELRAANAQLQIEIAERQQVEMALQVANQELQRLVHIDGLTQVANRRCFDSHLEQEWQRSIREQMPLALILCDVDFFKRYNDTYGHQRGDLCLQLVARAICDRVNRSSDLVARYGGEEFAVILPNTDAWGAMQVAKNLQAAIAQLQIPHAGSEVSAWVSLSLGIACLVPAVHRTTEQLIQWADQALYDAKSQGRNRAVLYRDDVLPCASHRSPDG